MTVLESWVNSFRRAPEQYTADTSYADSIDTHMAGKPEVFEKEKHESAKQFYETDDHSVMAMPEKSALKRTLDSRHVQFIALGGGIGTGLFI